ncbi:hypothetical protein OBBRIDRAFT_839050 [Obba rivulosa]|uniref:C3H1-type domain-containing protein n=1 Tax=Obba rivulosa TaxID=1052685 RepID=A0A8E2AIW1_9APHY|nr:hypothetical protein OBBRIDRAFT_839050 [Obba rivulosa]
MPVRCRWFNDDGRPVEAGCRKGAACVFIHPDNPAWATASKPYSGGGRGRGRGFAPPPASTGAPGGLPPPTGITPFGYKRDSLGFSLGPGGSSFGSADGGSSSSGAGGRGTTSSTTPTHPRKPSWDTAGSRAAGSGSGGWGGSARTESAMKSNDGGWGKAGAPAWGETTADSGWGESNGANTSSNVNNTNSAWATPSSSNADSNTNANATTGAGWGEQANSTRWGEQTLGWGDPSDTSASKTKDAAAKKFNDVPMKSPEMDASPAHTGASSGWAEPPAPAWPVAPPPDTGNAASSNKGDRTMVPPRQTPTPTNDRWGGADWPPMRDSPVGMDPSASPATSIQSGRGRDVSLPRGKGKDPASSGPSPFDSLLVIPENPPLPPSAMSSQDPRPDNSATKSSSASSSTYVPRDIILHEAWQSYVKHIVHAVNAEQGVREAEQEIARCLAMQQTRVYTKAELGEAATEKIDKAHRDAAERLYEAKWRRRQEIRALIQYAECGPSPHGDAQAEYKKALEESRAWLDEIQPQIHAASESLKQHAEPGLTAASDADIPAPSSTAKGIMAAMEERIGKVEQRADDLEEYLSQLRDSTSKLVDEEFKRQSAERMEVDVGEVVGAPAQPKDEIVTEMRDKLAAMQQKLQTIRAQCDLLRARDAESRAHQFRLSAEHELLKKERQDDNNARDQALANLAERVLRLREDVQQLVSQAPPAPPSIEDINRAVAGQALQMLRADVTEALEALHGGVQNALAAQEADICKQVAMDMQSPLLFLLEFEKSMNDGLFEPDPPPPPPPLADAGAVVPRR